MLCKNGDDLYLLPSCLDRWKQYTSMRKLWKRHLDFAESRMAGDTTKADKLWAFKKLQYSHDDRMKCLLAKPIDELKKLCLKNVDKLADLADKMDGDMDGIARCMEVLTDMMGGNNEKKPKPKKAKS